MRISLLLHISIKTLSNIARECDPTRLFSACLAYCLPLFLWVYPEHWHAICRWIFTTMLLFPAPLSLLESQFSPSPSRRPSPHKWGAIHSHCICQTALVMSHKYFYFCYAVFQNIHILFIWTRIVNINAYVISDKQYLRILFSGYYQCVQVYAFVCLSRCVFIL